VSAVLSFFEHRQRLQDQERMRRGDLYCLDCIQEEPDAPVFLQRHKVWGSQVNGFHCPRCGWDG